MRKLLYLLPLAVIIFYGDRLGRIFVPFAAAAVLTNLLLPSTAYIRKKTNLKETGAAAISMTAFVLLIALLLAAVIPVFTESLKDIVANSGEIAKQVENTLGQASKVLRRFLNVDESGEIALWLDRATGELCAKLFTAFENWAAGLLDKIASSYAQILDGIFDTVTALVITFYFLRDGRKLRLWFMELFPFSWRGTLSGMIGDLGRILSDFLKGQLLVSLILGVVQTCGLLLIGVPYAPVLGFFGALLNIIPYFGPFIGAVPAVIAAFLISPVKALWTLVFFVLLQQLDNNLLTPKIIEGKLKIHPVTTIVAVLVGGEFFGFWGILLGVPAYAALRSILKRVLPLLRQHS